MTFDYSFITLRIQKIALQIRSIVELKCCFTYLELWCADSDVMAKTLGTMNSVFSNVQVRSCANERERGRTQSVNGAFLNLR